MSKCNPPELGYMAFHSDAELRHKRGERQVYCCKCRLWMWPEHVSDEHRSHTLTRKKLAEQVILLKKHIDGMDRAKPKRKKARNAP